MGPQAVRPQSMARMRSPISPPPCSHGVFDEACSTGGRSLPGLVLLSTIHLRRGLVHKVRLKSRTRSCSNSERDRPGDLQRIAFEARAIREFLEEAGAERD